tara:strand:- start:102 stop:4028 length:3927 start_codon:yes stop_codon:yes gene_type:complete
VKKHFSIILILFILVSSCGGDTESNDKTETSDNTEINKNNAVEECLSDESVAILTSEIAEITSDLKNQEENLALLADATYSEEELQNMKDDLAVLERVQADYESELSNSGNNEYIQQLRDRKQSLESQLGISYADVDFANFGQDAILAEVYDGIIAPLENKENLSQEEQDVLDEARLKLELLDTELNLFRSFNEDPEVEIRLKEIERLKNEISVAEGTGDQALRDKIENLKLQLNDKNNILLSSKLCNPDSVYLDDNSGTAISTINLEGCLDLSSFIVMTNELAELNNWALHIEDSIRKRNEPINDEDTQYSENNLNSEFVETIDWESDSLYGLRDKIEQNIRYDRVYPSEDNLNKIKSYLEQVRDKTSAARIEILPLCDLYNIKNDVKNSDQKSTFTAEDTRDIPINRFCEVNGDSLDCPDNNLYIPQQAVSCDASLTEESYTNYDMIDQFFASSVYNPKWLRSLHGTRFIAGTGSDEPDFFKAYYNPQVIFPGEAVQIIIKDNLNFNAGKSKIEFNDEWRSSHGGNIEPPYLYDDGTHGDAVAGDGLYTNNCMKLTYDTDFSNESYVDKGGVRVVDPNLKGTVEIKHISENTWATRNSLFMNIGYDYSQYENNNYPIVFSPNLDTQAYSRIFKLFDDNINGIVLGSREYSHGGHMMRLADHIRGTGFFQNYYESNGKPAPAQDNKIKVGPWSDGKTHLELQMVLMLGSPEFGSFVHEFQHSIYGQTGGGKYGFPRPGYRESLSDDGMHLSPASTATNTLQGGFKVLQSDGRTYKPVFIVTPTERFSTRVVKDGDKFKAIKRDSIQDSQIFLYAAGLLKPEEVTETYYQLVNPTVIGCVETNEYFECDENNEVKATEVISWDINDYINHYGPRSFAYGEEPEKLNLTFSVLSERKFTEAEIVFSHYFANEVVNGDDNWRNPQGDEYNLNFVWGGLGGINFDIFEFLINSESYKTLEKVAITDIEYGDIKISDIDTYKELMYTGLEKNSTGLVEEAIQLIPSLPYAYMAMATLMDNDVDKYNYYDIAYTRAMNEIKKVSSITEFSLIFNLLEQKIKYNKRNNNEENVINEDQLKKDQELFSAYSINASWLGISQAKQEIARAKSQTCRADQEPHDHDAEHSDCDLANIKQNPVVLRELDFENPVWYDANLDDLLRNYMALAGGYKDIARNLLEGENNERASLDLYLKAIDTYIEGISKDPEEETFILRFLYRDMAYTYDDLVSHPAATEIEQSIFKAMATYYFGLEYPLVQQLCERFKGTTRSGGLVGSEDGKVYMADYVCGRPPVYEPEGEGRYEFDYNNWEFVRVG